MKLSDVPKLVGRALRTTEPWRDLEREQAPESDSSMVLLSIHPRHANAILTGTKTVELRRRPPAAAPGTLVLIYSTTPVRAVVGWAEIRDVVAGAPDALWDSHGALAEVSEDEFEAYFAGRELAFGLELSTVEAADQPVSLQVLREFGLDAPQSWRYVPHEVGQQIRTLAGTR